MSYTIYALFDERNPDAVRYVGLSSDVVRRISEHLADARKNYKQTRKAVWIRELLAVGLLPSWRALDIVETVEAAIAMERIRIMEFRQLGHAITNGTHGGDGATAWAKQETRDHQRQMMLSHWNSPESEAHRHVNSEQATAQMADPNYRGGARTDVARKRMSEAKLSKPHAKQRTAEWNKAIGDSQRGKKRRPWTLEERGRHMAGFNHEKMSASAKARTGRTRRAMTQEERASMILRMNDPAAVAKMSASAKAREAAKRARRQEHNLLDLLTDHDDEKK